MAEFGVEHVEMLHAVEQRNDRGLVADRRRERCDRILEVEGLAAQQHDVEFLVERVGLHGRRILQGDVAIRALDDETGGGKFGGPARPDQKRDVGPALQHPAAEKSADGPCPDHENAHALSSLMLLEGE